MKNKKNQKGFAPLLVIVVLAIVAAAVLYLNQNKIGTQQTAQNTPVIQNSDDLTSVSSDLDNTNTNELDTELNQISADASF